MEVKEAIAVAKNYITEIYADEQVSSLGLEEVEYDPRNENWMITVGFSRPWNGPRTRAAEVLESMGNSSARMRRSFKTVLITPDGKVLSMKNRETID